jgi:hypothetical protein
VGYQVSQSVRFWTKAGSSSRLWWLGLMNQFIEGKRRLGRGVTTTDGLVAQVCQQLYKPIVLSFLSTDWVFELQPIASCSCRIADICK